MLLLAGVHGDEYEGQVALSNLIRDLAPEDVRGRLIVMPATNTPAVAARTRVSPVDGGNLNRAFPGNRTGTATEMLAHYLETVILPRCDFMVDLHSGGASLCYPPTLLRGSGHTPDEAAVLDRLQAAFDLPYAWVFRGGGGPTSTARTAMGVANRAGVVSVMAELGGAGALSSEILAVTERGLRRVLHTLGMLPDYAPGPPAGTRAMHTEGSVYVYQSGIFQGLKSIADPVAKGEVIGWIHDPTTSGSDPVAVASTYEGVVLAQRPLAAVERGDAVYQIARDIVAE